MSFGASTMSNNMRLAYSGDGTSMYSSMRNSGENNPIALLTAGMDSTGSEVVKRKRGRPRKYPFDVSKGLATRLLATEANAQAGGFSSQTLSSGKKARGRPPGSLNKQHPAASGSPGVGFLHHILDVKAGEVH
ncbi:hypothetical protein L2E82_20038 [Cichorium intybus]|uniref:Uncharacterized protein n=1 Tax=Cichorium intybus TaxID=13427 RepID=A0ACB9DT82_CICIN|nr:hypothetical protein L2E82_20038 [Cichorium intybus]